MSVPAAREPALRQKSNGAWFVRWAGKDHYLGVDRATAEWAWLSPESPHAGSRSKWQAWREESAYGREGKADKVGHGAGASSLRTNKRLRRLTLTEASVLFLRHCAKTLPLATATYYRKHLQRFLELHGPLKLHAITSTDPRRMIFSAPIVQLLEAYRQDMVKADPAERLAPRTIRHDVSAVKRLIAWCHSPGNLCPTVSFAGLGAVSVPPSRPTPVRPSEIQATLTAMIAIDPALVPHLAISYLTGARPSEVVRLVKIYGGVDWCEHGVSGSVGGRGEGWRGGGGERLIEAIEDEHGNDVGDGALVLHLVKHKMEGEGQIRPVLFTREALSWLALAHPFWPNGNEYAKACREVFSSSDESGEGGATSGTSAPPAAPPKTHSEHPPADHRSAAAWPSRLRDSFASHLLKAGAREEDVDLLLGHDRRGVLQSYGEVPWPKLLPWASRISLAKVLDRFPSDYTLHLRGRRLAAWVRIRQRQQQPSPQPGPRRPGGARRG